MRKLSAAQKESSTSTGPQFKSRAQTPWVLLLKYFPADHLEGWSTMHHGISCEFLTTPGTLQSAASEVLNDALLVALDQRPLASLLIP